MELILHIGTEKTGTTSLQNWLDANDQKLRDVGVWYCESLNRPNNRFAALYAQDSAKRDDGFLDFGLRSNIEIEDFRRKIRAEFTAEVQTAAELGARHFVISSEHCHSRLTRTQDIQILFNLISNHFSKVSVLCFLRPQVEVAVSLASTACRIGDLVTADSLESIGEDDPYYNYFHLAQRWQSVFGTENFHPVPQKKFPDIVGYFLDLWGLDASPFSKPQRSNSGLDYRVIRLANNVRLSRYLDGEPNYNRDIFVDDFDFQEPLTISRVSAARIQERFLDSNKNLVALFPSLSMADLEVDLTTLPERGNIEDHEIVSFSDQLCFLVTRFNVEIWLERCEKYLLMAQTLDDSLRFLAAAEDCLRWAAQAKIDQVQPRLETLGSHLQNLKGQYQKASNI